MCVNGKEDSWCHLLNESFSSSYWMKEYNIIHCSKESLWLNWWILDIFWGFFAISSMLKIKLVHLLPIQVFIYHLEDIMAVLQLGIKESSHAFLRAKTSGLVSGMKFFSLTSHVIIAKRINGKIVWSSDSANILYCWTVLWMTLMLQFVGVFFLLHKLRKIPVQWNPILPCPLPIYLSLSTIVCLHLVVPL